MFSIGFRVDAWLKIDIELLVNADCFDARSIFMMSSSHQGTEFGVWLRFRLVLFYYFGTM